ncbi:MAG: SIMPL domain-containing protein [Alphaproteobacteria bacterium]|nr:SIMPL domain-containing protein [Alphaproteobacteria bacterium]
MSEKYKLASVILAFGIALGGFFPGYYYYQSQLENRTVTVKGLAEMNVKANLAIWKIKFKTTGNDLALIQKKMDSDLASIKAYLLQKGFQASEIIIGRMNTNDLMTNPYRDAKAEDSRYILDQTITVRSENVEQTETALREIGSLVAQGIIFDTQDYSSPISYLFTGLNQIKPQMLEQATQNAKQAAEEFAKSSGSTVGKIKNANQGVFSILPREQIPGANETDQIEKTVRVVSTVVYYLN